jgi:DNA repair protein RecO
MGQYTTQAIVVGVHNWGDADKMVTFMTKEHGKVKAAAYGCRRPKSPLAAGMQMFNYIELQLTEGQRLDTVKQYSLKKSFKAISADLTVMAYASFVAELARELCPEREPHPEVFAKLLEVLESLSKRNPRIAALIAGYQLLEYTGCQLSFSRCVHCGEPIEGDRFFSLEQGGAVCGKCGFPGIDEFPETLRFFIEEMLAFDWQAQLSLRVNGAQLVRAERLLLLYLQHLLTRPLKSLAFIEQLSLLQPEGKKVAGR